MRIEVGDGKSIVPLACDTIDRLTSLVFATSSLDVTAQIPSWICETVEDLLRTDESFRSWAERREVASSPEALASKLVVLLASDSSWMTKAPNAWQPLEAGALSVGEACFVGGQQAASRPARQAGRTDCVERTASDERRLWQAVQIVLRLVTIESRFATCLESAKREAIYQLAYGLSHEINNPLANIATRARVLAEGECDPQRQQLLVAIVDQAMRGCEMIGDLMLVARPPKLDCIELDLGNFLCEIVEQARPWAEQRSVTLNVDCIASDCRTKADATALREALWCLLRNSLEAVATAGRIEIRCEPSSVEGFLRIAVQDNGPGLSAEALRHCFDPYYSGREAGRGLGLGLAKAERIVSLHRGQLTIANCPTGGCIASIELPTIRSSSN